MPAISNWPDRAAISKRTAVLLRLGQRPAARDIVRAAAESELDVVVHQLEVVALPHLLARCPDGIVSVLTADRRTQALLDVLVGG